MYFSLMCGLSNNLQSHNHGGQLKTHHRLVKKTSTLMSTTPALTTYLYVSWCSLGSALKLRRFRVFAFVVVVVLFFGPALITNL